MDNYFSFTPKFRSRRNGFAHDCTLLMYINNVRYEFKNTCYYINRTWEPYTFYSVKNSCLYSAKKFFTDKLTKIAKEKTGKTLRSFETKKVLEELIKNSPELSFIKSINL